MFDKILIANRGEIAIRIIRACREMGIKTMAVHSEADADCLHVQLADEAVCIGPAAPSESYLKIDRIISAAEVGNVDAIHPGYGFLAENEHFAEVCESANIKFIGPTSANIKAMGNKSAAREAAKKAGVPITPGSEGPIENEGDALRWAKKLGYPVMIKAASGGGGRGMRPARNDVSLVKGFYTARAEAERAFGDPTVYIEKLIENGRHIEVQILGDTRGKVLHFYERDCSIQRRNQKLIEECPSPFVEKSLRKQLCKASVRLAEAVKYVSAGTVEFLVDERQNYYFCEMNTRIQVEHAITEEMTRSDLIKEMIRIAAGEKLAWSQGDVVTHRHAIECRVNAEDPFNNFMPSPGRIEFYHPPGGHGIRIDSHAYAGYVIPPHYDSLIAKLITHAHDRPTALLRMQRALDEFIIRGVKTTLGFEKMVMQDSQFRRGKYDLNFVPRLLGDAASTREEA